MDSSHQARFDGVIFLKIDAAVINEKPFRTKHVLINISITAPPIFKFKVSVALSHQARLNGVILSKLDGAVLEILMKTHFVRNTF